MASVPTVRWCRRTLPMVPPLVPDTVSWAVIVGGVAPLNVFLSGLIHNFVKLPLVATLYWPTTKYVWFRLRVFTQAGSVCVTEACCVNMPRLKSDALLGSIRIRIWPGTTVGL